jgi:hypothetical protein
MLSPDDLAGIFAGAAGAEWAGPTIEVPAVAEFVPFVFNGAPFLLQFSDILSEASNDPVWLAEMSDNWAGGQVASKDARMVKFYRAEAANHANASRFKHEEWSLPAGRGIMSFGSFLAHLVARHQTEYVAVDEYYYTVASPKLAKLYDRAFTTVCKNQWLEGVAFSPIQMTDGSFYGYQRNTAVASGCHCA